jgi:hypothetical protein
MRFGTLANLKLDNLLTSILRNDCTIALMDSFGPLREAQRWEEMEWLSKELDIKLISPLWERSRLEPFCLTVLACGGYTGRESPVTGSPEGLVLSYKTGQVASNSIPFDERALEERTLQTSTPWEAIEKGIQAP